MDDTRILPGLSALSASEREVLSLFADGHTAKSVATITGLSVSGVNERLRAARRKTGVASSRELARALRLRETRFQENRTEEIGLPSAATPAATPSPPADRHAGRRIIIMSFLSIAAAAAVFTMQQQAPPAPATAGSPPGLIAQGSRNDDGPLTTACHPLPSPDPTADLPEPPDPAACEAKVVELWSGVRKESAEEPWSSNVTLALLKRYRDIPLIGSSGSILRGRCGSTLCEVDGDWPGHMTFDDAQAVTSGVMAMAGVRQSRPVPGLTPLWTGVSKDRFVAYWRRTEP